MVVSDYRPGEEKSWNDLRATFAALANQDFDEPVGVFALENLEDLEQMPTDVPQTLPGVRVIASDARGSYELKNVGVQAATADLVMVLDADCVPDRGWVRAGVDAMRKRPDALAISGRTTYPGRSTLERSLGLLSRSYVDRGKAGQVRLLSTNNMIVRRRVFCANPLPSRSRRLRLSAGDRATVASGGQAVLRACYASRTRFRRLADGAGLAAAGGWTSIRIRQLDADIPGAKVVRLLGPASVPLLYAYRLIESTGPCFRLPRHFGLHWRHIPLLLALAMLVHSFELPGMFRALARPAGGSDRLSLILCREEVEAPSRAAALGIGATASLTRLSILLGA